MIEFWYLEKILESLETDKSLSLIELGIVVCLNHYLCFTLYIIIKYGEYTSNLVNDLSEMAVLAVAI